MMRLWILLGFLIFNVSAAYGGAKDTLVNWQSWSPKIFEQAAKENKLILLEMEAVWCHWCHVMDKETYSQPLIADYIHQHYIPVRVDHDARPDLANRYREWGWPATIILRSDGIELVKRAGYIAPDPFQRLLAAVVADPSPEATANFSAPVEAARSNLSANVRVLLHRRFVEQSDLKRGGLRINQKFIEPGVLEYALATVVDPEAKNADVVFARQVARKTLDGALNLIDPVWGGVYQYSTHGDWQHPHYEKLASIQARYLQLYSLAAKVFKDARYAQAAEQITNYVERFLTAPSGAFYVSQDADLVPGQKSHDYFAAGDDARTRQGIPRVDKNIYARENGLLIEALLRQHQYQSDTPAGVAALKKARKALQVILETHRRHEGFSHAESEHKARYLEDNLAMAKALLAMYEITAERRWLGESLQVAGFIDQHFRHPNAGWLDAQPEGLLKPHLGIDINVAAGRFFNRLYHYSGQQQWRRAAEHAMRFLSAESVALSRIEDSAILLFDQELNRPPIHYAVVAAKTAPLAKSLFLSGLGDPVAYKRIEWWDRAEGVLLHNDVPYPKFPMPAAYVCTDKRCSAPAFDEPNWTARREGLLRVVD